MNALDKIINYFSPASAFKRARYRSATAAYEAAKPSRLRKNKPDNSSGNAVVGLAGDALRGHARQLEQNYDLAQSILDVLVVNSVGPNGITKEPRPKAKTGEIHEKFAQDILALWEDFSEKPEVTWEHDYPSLERLCARTLLRDGEHLIQFVEGNAQIQHGTKVPFSVELIEADQLPFGFSDESKKTGDHDIEDVEVFQKAPVQAGFNSRLRRE